MLPGHNILLQAETSRRMCPRKLECWFSAVLGLWHEAHRKDSPLLGGVPGLVQWANCRETITVRFEAVFATAVCWSKLNSKHGRIISAQARNNEISKTECKCSLFLKRRSPWLRIQHPCSLCCCTYHSSNGRGLFSAPCFLRVIIRKRARAVAIRTFGGIHTSMACVSASIAHITDTSYQVVPGSWYHR